MSSLEDMLRLMTQPQNDLLTDICSFLALTGMGESYFGKRSVGNSELVSRLRKGRPVLNETERRAREFMTERLAKAPVRQEDAA